MANNTKIVNAYNTLTISDLTLGHDASVMIPVGRSGYNVSENISIATLKTHINEEKDNITASTTIAKVFSSGEFKITLSGTDKFIFTASSLLPKTSNIDLGNSSIKFKHLWLDGGINVGSDATGDLYYRDSTGKFERLPIKAVGKVLKVGASGVPAWETDAVGNYRADRLSLTGNNSINISFSSNLGSTDANVILNVNGYDGDGNPVVIKITNISISGFTAEAAANCTIHYTASLKTT